METYRAFHHHQLLLTTGSLVAFLAVATSLSMPGACASETIPFFSKIKRSSNPAARIAGLSFEAQSLQLMTTPLADVDNTSDTITPFSKPVPAQSKLVKPSALPVKASEVKAPAATYGILLRGGFTEKNSSLIVNGKTIRLRPKDHGFTIPLIILGSSSRIHFSAIDPYGTIHDELVSVECPGFSKIPAWVRQSSLAPSNIFSASLGPTIISFRQTGIADTSQTALTGKVAYSRLLARGWEVGGSVFMTLTTLSTSAAPASSSSSQNLRFLGVNARGGYTWPLPNKRWSLSLLGGGYYTTMLIPADGHGFKNQFGPQLFPVLKTALNPKVSAQAYLKFSPVTATGSFFTLADRELAAGVGASYRLRNAQALGIYLDWAALHLEDAVSQIDSNTLSLSFGYSF